MAATSPSPPPTRHKRNLLGNWAVSGQKMPGMGAANDLGIWFMFNDISIQQPGTYALRFRCFDLAETQNTQQVASLSSGPKVTRSVEASKPESAKDALIQTPDGYLSTPASPPAHGPSKSTRTGTDAQSRGMARALCEVISDEFDVWGGKGMPSWPVGTTLTAYFSR
ncbi:hypothetical protein QFC19_001467 [Naganishia cerealis]|uniref:Uncharacterized protein n=1 Tax=Naganishia cerealis TaxID=610337 RepID=A0ACC2WGP5_9TREE|nr:hypothetical protein QFC19_001467 [Naganishia cerealis]